MTRAGVRRAWPEWTGALSVSVLLSFVAGLASAKLFGCDADWDFRNYHLYDGFAILDGRLGLDIAPAQLQTFLAPTQDIFNDVLLRLLNHHPLLLSGLLALPQGVAWFVTWILVGQVITLERRGDRMTWTVIAAIGATGSAGISTLSLAPSDMTGATFFLGAVVLLIRLSDVGSRQYIFPGILGGIAVGLKLTFVPFFIGLVAGAMFTTRLRRVRGTIWFLSGSVIGAGVFAGWWWGWLWIHYGNPFFPFFNNWFRSPWVSPQSWADGRFFPKSWLLALAYPVSWGIEPSTHVSEITMRDPRIMLGGIAAIVLLGRALWHRAVPERPVVILLIVWVVSYWLWEARFSIYRYLATLELLTGPLIAAAAMPLLRRLDPRWAIPGIAAGVLGITLFTIYPNWGHTPLGSRAVAVRLPRLPPGSLVVMLGGAPMGYVAAFAPRDVRFVGADNNLLHPGAPGRLEAEVVRAIRTQVGPLWGLWSSRHRRAPVRAALAAYHLAFAGSCRTVRSNLDADALRVCSLRRTPRTPPPMTTPRPRAIPNP